MPEQLSDTDSRPLDPRFSGLNRWTFLGMQVFECFTFLDLAESTHKIHAQSSVPEVFTQQALFRSFLLAYGKCFVSGGTGRSKLDPSKVYAKAAEQLKIHERLMFLRHKYAAHGDDSGLEEATICVTETPDAFKVQHIYSVENPLDEYDSYRSTLNSLQKYIEVGINKHLDSLQVKLGKQIKS